MSYLKRSGAQALKIAAGATSGEITGIVVGLQNVLAEDTLSIPAPATAIRLASAAVDSGAFTLPADFPWPGRSTFAAVTISNASPAGVTWPDHGLPENTAVVLETTEALPTGLTPATVYFVKDAGADTFTLSETPGGSAIATSSAGSGTHTAARADWLIDRNSGLRSSSLYSAQQSTEALALLAQIFAQAPTWRCTDIVNELPEAPFEKQTVCIGTDPVGEAASYANFIAIFLMGGWRFFAPLVGHSLTNAAGQTMAVWNGTSWGVNADMAGAASSVDGHVPLFDGLTGKKLKSSGKALPAGAVVGTSDAQTLTNKTLTSPTLGGVNASLIDFILNGSTDNERFFAGDGSFRYPPGVQKRQCLNFAPVGSDGLGNWLPSSATGLVLTAAGVDADNPLVANASFGRRTRVGIATSNPQWTVPNSQTSYIGFTIAADGTMTPVVLSTAPVYVEGGTPATTNGLATFDISRMTMFLGNSTTAPQTYLVIVGEVVASGGNITSTVMYALNGRYFYRDSSNLPAANTAISKNHNIGVGQVQARMFLECVITDAGHAVGSVLWGAMGWYGAASSHMAYQPITTRLTVSLRTAATNAFEVISNSNGQSQNTTAANWRYGFLVERTF